MRSKMSVTDLSSRFMSHDPSSATPLHAGCRVLRSPDILLVGVNFELPATVWPGMGKNGENPMPWRKNGANGLPGFSVSGTPSDVAAA